MTLSTDEIKTLVQMLGREGAISGIINSKKVTADEIRSIAKSIGLKIDSKSSNKQTIAESIIRFLDKRISKSIEEIKGMSKDDIASYLEKTECDIDEILDLLSQIDLAAKTKSSKKALIDYAAIQLSSFGIFERLAESDNSSAE